MDKMYRQTKGFLLQGTSRPVVVKGKNIGTQVLRSCGDAARIFGLAVEDIVVAADGGATVKTRCGQITFSWPSLTDMRKRWPNALLAAQRRVAAHPCTIHCLTPGPHGQAYDLDVRSITATRLYLGLSEREFETVVNKLPGWRQICPPHVVGITVHKPGYRIRNPLVAPGSGGVKFFTLESRTTGIHMELTDGHPQDFAHLRDVPDFVLKNAVWA